MQRIEHAGMISRSFRDVPAFEVVVPDTLDDAVRVMGEVDRPVPYAGGTHLCAAVREGTEIGTLVWLRRLAALRGVERRGDRLSIGALTTHHDGARSPETAAVPGLPEAWRRIANVRVRLAATVGGNLMARHRRYEMSILLSALGGVARFAQADGEATLTPDEIWSGPSLDRALLTRLEIPLSAELRLDYDRSLRPIMTQALALWTDDAGAPRGRAVIATEYLRPFAMELDLADGAEPRDVAAAAFASLPEDFADPATGQLYLKRAGSAILARQLIRLGGTA